MNDACELINMLGRRIADLEAESQIRRLRASVLSLYESGCRQWLSDQSARIEEVLRHHTADAIWEGDGAHYGRPYFRAIGHSAIRRHFQATFGPERQRQHLIVSNHVGTEQLHIETARDHAEAFWVQVEPWIFADGSCLLRSSRIQLDFVHDGGIWKIARTKTEPVISLALSPQAGAPVFQHEQP